MNAETPGSGKTPGIAHEALLTVTEVADRLRVSEAYVKRLVRKGTLPALDLPGVIRIPRTAVDRIIQDAA